MNGAAPGPRAVWKLVLAKLPAGPHLSKSRTKKALRGLARNTRRTLAGPGGVPPGRGAAITAAAVLLATGTGAHKAAPHVKNKLHDLRSKVNRRSTTANRQSQDPNPEPGPTVQPEPEATSERGGKAIPKPAARP